ncbi:putative trehalose-phosphate phosphatase 6 [Platanthera zijinensis]|uniref:Trehalose-phosphate phosphatase 6 n=1 Tax=Platanthera zijinensis TaxID=2320716 RepID=A0AAP0G0N7_9ASPA
MALKFLLESLGVLRSRGHGSAILVSKMPKETNASYSLQEPSEASVLDSFLLYQIYISNQKRIYLSFLLIL